MTVNIAFGPVTLQAGFVRDFGPYVVKAGDDQVSIVIDRTLPNGLDATPGAAIEITVNQSSDGGATWTMLVSAHVPGGILTYTDRQGVVHQFTTSNIQTGLDLAKAQIKATVIVGDTPVRVAGTFAVN